MIFGDSRFISTSSFANLDYSLARKLTKDFRKPSFERQMR